MMKHDKRLICFLIIFTCVVYPALCDAEYDYIDISNPFLQKIPIAVPLFKPVSGDQAEISESRDLSDLLAETLEYTRYFKLLRRDATIDATDVVSAGVNFKTWTNIGAELLVTGSFAITDGILEIELRLFDTIKERMLVGKRYKGLMVDKQKIIRRFCGEIIYFLTGSRGIFESRIAFVSTTSGNKEIFICDFDGQNPEQFTNHKQITLSPAWSSDGNWIAYTSWMRGKPDLYIKELRSSRGAVVAKKGINITPAWVPGKLQLAATLSFEDDQEIYLLTHKGEIVKRLTNRLGTDLSPTWSPDGRKMAFVSERSGTPQIYIQDIKSGETERLTFQGQYNTQPSWSPKGDKIAYSSRDDGEFNIIVVSADGKKSLQLTRNEGNNESPTWSPDGSLIGFSSTREGASRIYVMTAYGTDKRRLLAIPGEQTDPKWSPGVVSN